MNRLIASLCAGALAGSVVLSGGQIQLPDAPAKGFGTSITGAFEGWYDAGDGAHIFLVGYYNRNVARDMDVPIGPNNRIEPGGPDMGQPTHFVKGRQTGVFNVTVPKAFSKDQRLTWTITANGVTTSIPLRLHTDYNISPFTDAAVGNTPPVLHLFDESAKGLQGPVASMSTAVAKTATVSSGLTLPIWLEDDAKFTSGTNAPMRNPPPPTTVTWSMYRGSGNVVFDNPKPTVLIVAGGKVGEPFKGKATTVAKFSQPGEYALHVTVNDYSGSGGGGELCCWTTALVKVNVTQ
jgi:hypothetical protein